MAMGYSTDFAGRFTLDKPLTSAQADYLRRFAETRRVWRRPELTEERDDPLREDVDLPVGKGGGYFVGETGFAGQDRGYDIRDSNTPAPGQPSLWCQWTVSEDNQHIEWNGGEKFYEYVPWLKYIISHFLQPWGYILNGQVQWQGERSADTGIIEVNANVVSTHRES